MGFAKSAEQVAALLKVKKITLDSIFEEILDDQTLAYSNISREQRYIPSGQRSPIMFVGQNPVFPRQEDLDVAKQRKKPLEMFEVSNDTKNNENGLLLNKCCKYLNLERSEVYITNAVKYPTINNEEPLFIDAKNHIKKFLFKEIFVVKPEIIFIMGNTVQSWFEKTFNIEISEDPKQATLNLKIDNERIEYEVWIQKIHHPAYVKRNGSDFSLYEKQLDRCKSIVEEIILDWKYVHLHSHNSFSMKDGIGDPGTRINWAVENRRKALATSNHGNIFDWLQIYNRCKAEKIKPILGCEFYFNRKGLELQEALESDEPENVKKRKELRKLTNHFTAFAKNIEGFYNMIKINNDAWTNRFYRNPIVAPEIIEENKSGIICLSGCSGSEANRVIASKFYLTSEDRKEDVERLIENKLNSMRGVFRNKSFEKYYDDEYLDDWDEQYFNDRTEEKLDEDDYIKKAKQFILNSDEEQIEYADIKAREIIDWWHKVFGEDFYIELMVIDFPPQILINQELIKIAKEKNIPIVITNDVHYLNKKDAMIQQLQMLNDQNHTWEDLRNDVENKIWTIKGSEFYYKSVQELKDAWEQWHKNELFTEEIFWEGIKNAIVISEKIEDFTIDKSNKLPKMSENSEKLLAKKISEGMKQKGLDKNKEYLDRVKFEYKVICEKGFADYFLIINDVIQYAKNNFGVNSVGPGRGCFLPETKIRMYNNTFKNIEKIKIDDKVISGWGARRHVNNRFVYDIDEEACKVILKNGDTISCTKDHKILVIPKGQEKNIKNAVWKPASNLIEGDVLIKNV